MRIKRVTSLFLTLFVLAIMVVPALAVPPDHIEFPNSQSYLVADCGDFEVINYEQSTIRLTFFFDSEGNPVRVNQFWSGTDTLTNSVTGKAVASDFHNHAVYDLSTSTVHQSGVFWHVNVPHQGQVYFMAGQVIGIDFEQPDAEITFTGAMNLDEEMLCSLLAG